MESLKHILESTLALAQSRKGQAAIFFVLSSFGFEIEPELQVKLIAVVVSVLMAAIALEDSAAKFNAFYRSITIFDDNDDSEGEVYLN